MTQFLSHSNITLKLKVVYRVRKIFFHNLDSIDWLRFRFKASIGQPKRNMIISKQYYHVKIQRTNLAISHKATTMPMLPNRENIAISLIFSCQNLTSEKEMIK